MKNHSAVRARPLIASSIIIRQPPDEDYLSRYLHVDIAGLYLPIGPRGAIST